MIKIDASGRRFRKRDDVFQQIEMSLDRWGSVTAAIRSSEYTFETADATAMIIFDHGGIFELNHVAAFVWEQLADGLTIDELATAVAKTFEVETQVAADDVVALVRELNTRGLLCDVTPK